ncbi:MAG: glycosyltransferase family 2 protein [Flavobacteriales bacterium]
MSETTSIDLIIPVFNPPVGWAEKTKTSLLDFQSQLGQTVNLIIVDDGSKNQAELEQLQTLVPSIRIERLQKNRGKGSALRHGFKLSNSDVALFTDADFPYEVSSMKDIAQAIDRGADVALGYREQDYYASVPWFRKGLSEAFRFILKSILKFPVTDTQCGLKGMSSDGRQVFLKTNIDRFMVDMEFIKIATRNPALKVVPVVVKLRPNVEFSSMGPMVLMREVLNFLKVLLS